MHGMSNIKFTSKTIQACSLV